MRLILCAALAVIWGTAAAQVNKCVDPEGHVLLTDAPCPQTDTQERVTAAASPAPLVAPAVRSRWADLPRALARKSASIDASTLQTAHQSMLLQDELRKSRRLVSSR